MSIEERIIKVINKIKSTPVEENDGVYVRKITGDLGLSGVEFAYFVMELAEEFDMVFQKEDFENYKFNSIKSVAEIIRERMS